MAAALSIEGSDGLDSDDRSMAVTVGDAELAGEAGEMLEAARGGEVESQNLNLPRRHNLQVRL